MSNYSQDVSDSLKGNETTVEDSLRAIDGSKGHCDAAEKLTTTINRGDDGKGAAAGERGTANPWMAVGDNCEGVANDGLRSTRPDSEVDPLQRTINEGSEKDALSEGDFIADCDYTESEQSADGAYSCQTGLCVETIRSLKHLITRFKWCECQQPEGCNFYRYVETLFVTLLIPGDTASSLETETSVAADSACSKDACSGSDKDNALDNDLSARPDSEDNCVDNEKP